MPIEKMKFSPENGFLDTVSYPNPENEEQVREQFMRPSVQLREFVNSLISQMESENGASNIGTNINPNAEGSTIMAQLLSLGQNTADHKARYDNPHFVTKAQVGLGNVDNTADSNKPISTAMQIALDGKEPAFSKNTAFNKGFGVSAADLRMNGLASVGSLDLVARIDHVHPTDTSRAPLSHTHSESEILNLTTDLNSKAPLLSPNLTGVPTAPTAIKGANSKQVATTEFVQQSLGAGGYGDMMKAIYDPQNMGRDVFADLNLKAFSNLSNVLNSTLREKGSMAGFETTDGAQAKSDNAKIQAINTAAADATNKVNTAKIEAINTATTDTANKTNAIWNSVNALATTVSLKTECVFGKYKGNDQASQFINLGFTPKAVLVLTEYGQTSENSTSYGGFAFSNAPCKKYNGTMILDIVPNGFQCYQNTREAVYCNYINFTYHYITFN